MSALPCLSWDQVSARRLERGGLSAPLAAARPAGIAQAMCGAHAQIMSAAELSIGLRTDRITQDEIRAALWGDHSLIKTYGPRGTVHLLPAQDLPMWCGALSVLPYGQRADPRSELLTPDQAEAVIQGIAVVLENAELTTDELTAALMDQVGSWAGDPVMSAFQGMWPRWRIAQATAGVRGALCFGPNRGRNVTFTSPRRWLPGFRPANQMEAVGELVRRYLYSYGPAAPHHFARWLAAPPRWAEDLFNSLSGEIEPVDFNGAPAWVITGDTAAPSAPPQGVRLLPYFDAFAVGCYPRERLFPGRAAERALAGGQAGNFPVLLVDGVVSGVWNQRRSGKKIDITVEPLVELTAAQQCEIDAQTARIGEIQAGRAQWRLGVVKTGPHA